MVTFRAVLSFVAVASSLACSGGDDAPRAVGAAGSGGGAGSATAGAAGATAGAAGAGGASSGAGGSATAGAPAAACDPVAQTCPPGPQSKCTLVTVAGHNTPACVEDHGAVAEGAPCQRDVDGPAGFGHDDCDKGLFCTFIGVLPPSAGGTRRCRTLCHVDATCPTGQRCAALDDASPANGFCGATCQPFGAACPTGLECSRLWPAADPAGPAAFVTCRLPGSKARGAACDPVAEDCVAGHVCVDPALGQAPSCLPLCDDAHPCAAGTCVMPAGLGAGVCWE